MGERLVISIERRGNRYATAYYHWSGYTRCALHTIRDAVEYLKNIDTEKLGYLDNMISFEKCAVEALLKTGAGLSLATENITACKERNIEITDETKAVDRNNGIIDISRDGMCDSAFWADEYCSIDISTKIVNIENIFWQYESLAQYNENYSDEYKWEEEDFCFYDCEYNLASMKLSEFEEFLEKIEEEKDRADKEYKRFLIRAYGRLFQYIE